MRERAHGFGSEPRHLSSGSSGRKRKRKFLTWSVLFLIAVITPLALFGWKETYVSFLERDAPVITVANLPPGIGLQPLSLPISISDDGSGLDLVKVLSEQYGEEKTLLRVPYTGRKVNQDTLTLDIPGKESGFAEGEVKIIISAFDKSFWSNGKTEVYTLVVDYTKPKLEVLSTQHNAFVGGSELVFYRLIGERDIASGLRAGSKWFFPGFSAAELDPSFKNHSDVYFSLFAIPLDFEPEKDRLVVYAKDAVGNLTTAPMYHRVKEVRNSKREVKLGESFIHDRVEPLLEEYLKARSGLGQEKVSVVVPGSTVEQLVQNFRLVNEDYRALIARSVAPLFQRPRRERLWADRFIQFPGAVQARFGDFRSYTIDGVPAGSSIHEGIDLASTKHEEVRAANTGVVIFADEMGIYGNTVIMDHGFGLYTLYGHLSRVSSKEGTKLGIGDVLGYTGNTGLAEGDHLHFEFRLHGVPVNPIEWMDRNWVSDHIEEKIAEMKRVVGVDYGSPLR